MTRLAKALQAGLLASTCIATGAAAETLIFGTDLSPTHVVSVHGADALMNCIQDRTDGAYDFNYFPSGQLIKRNEGIKALKDDLVQFAFITVPLETATIPMQSVTMLPGLSASANESVTAWRNALDQGGVLAKEWEDAGIVPIIASALAPYQIMSEDPYDSIETWSGKKVRTTGSALNFMAQSLGAVPVEMSARDLYTAMQQGTVDSTVLSFSSVKSYSLHEIIKSMSSNGSFGTSSQVFAMSAKKYNSLSPEHQKIFSDCGREAEQEMSSYIDATEGGLRKEFADLGINVFEYSPEALAAFDTAMSDVAADFLARLTERGLPGDEALAEFKAGLGK